MVFKFKYLFNRLVIFILALQLLNQSIDAIEFTPYHFSNSISFLFNDFNSISEYVSEVILEHKNSFPENYSNNKTDKAATKKSGNSIKLPYHNLPSIVTAFQSNVAKNYFTEYVLNLAENAIDITAPPPKNFI